MAVRTFLPYTKKVRKPQNQEYALFPQTVGEHIRKVRIERDLSQHDVARSIGVSDESIYYWENGRSVPQVQLYPAIIAFLGYYPFEHDTRTIAGKLQQLIYCNGWSHKECAKMLRLDSGTIKRILLGKRTMTTKIVTIIQLWHRLPQYLKQQHRPD
jgi:DNA-binding XRE family transcriptional regulator